MRNGGAPIHQLKHINGWPLGVCRVHWSRIVQPCVRLSFALSAAQTTWLSTMSTGHGIGSVLVLTSACAGHRVDIVNGSYGNTYAFQSNHTAAT